MMKYANLIRVARREATMSDREITELARAAYHASFEATGDRGCADDAARETVAELASTAGFFDAETLTWTSDEEPIVTIE